MEKAALSVVIPAYNEENFLGATLASFNEARSRFTAATGLAAEVIVVDNASTDQTVTKARLLGAVVVRHEVRNISSVRNAGIRAAAGSVIVTIDADCSLPPDALTRIWEFMEDERYVGATLGLRIISDKRAQLLVAIVIQRLASLISGIQGAVFCFRRDDALEMGGFPEDRLIGEDSAFAIALRKHARAKGKHLGSLRGSVKVGALVRKDLGLRALTPLIIQVVRAFAGAKQKPEELGFWYDPKR